jgi:hypothetical protein
VPGRVLFHDPNPLQRKVAERALAATQAEVTLVSNIDSLLLAVEVGGHDLTMVTYEPPTAGDPRWNRLFDLIRDQPHARLVLQTSTLPEHIFPLMAQRRYLRNLIAKSDEPFDADEIIVTSEKILRNDLFGLEKYLLWGIRPTTLPIRDSRDKNDLVGEVAAYARRLGSNERLVEMAESIADELTTNALYDAPRDATGQPRYAARSRRDPVTLAPDEAGTLSFACDGNYFAISAVDPFGSLTHDTIVDYLGRCFTTGPQPEDRPGGAGIGFFRVFQTASKFVVNIDPGRRTEVICLLDLRVSLKRFRQSPKSFHSFTTLENSHAS